MSTTLRNLLLGLVLWAAWIVLPLLSFACMVPVGYVVILNAESQENQPKGIHVHHHYLW